MNWAERYASSFSPSVQEAWGKYTQHTSTPSETQSYHTQAADLLRDVLVKIDTSKRAWQRGLTSKPKGDINLKKKALELRQFHDGEAAKK